jgi:hypothetical protein
MKYNYINIDKNICFPNIYDDDIEWFKKQPDPLNSVERQEVENIYNKIINTDNVKEHLKLLKSLLKYLSQTNKITKITHNVLNETINLVIEENKLKKISLKKSKFQVKDKNIFMNFLQNGIYGFNINNDLFIELTNNLNNKINKLKTMEKPKIEIYERGYLLERTLRLEKDSLDIINKILIDKDILNIAKKYYNCDFMLNGAILHRSTDEDEHCVQTLNDLVKENPPRHKNCHIDPKLNVKCMIYLTNVGLNDGPFYYVQGSHLYKKDHIIKRNIAKSINVYNINNTPSKRMEFLCLPKDFQNSSNFGNYILNNSKNGLFLKENLKPLTSEFGNLILFDPDGIHMGGNTNGGERIAIQVILKPQI